MYFFGIPARREDAACSSLARMKQQCWGVKKVGHLLGYIQAIIKEAPQRMTYELSQFDQNTRVYAIKAFYQVP